MQVRFADKTQEKQLEAKNAWQNEIEQEKNALMGAS